MRKFLKNLTAIFLVPLTRWYLRKKRKYTYRQTEVSVLPGVFHPGLFSSTILILKYLEKKVMAGQSLLEMGSGAGLISIMAAKAEAKVTAVDISKTAIENTILNATANGVQIEVIHSDLFENVSRHAFDWIVINPPYYARVPKDESDFAWYCGENFEYFIKLFTHLPAYLHPASIVIVALTKGCDLEEIFRIARSRGFRFQQLQEKYALFDGKDILYRLVPTKIDEGGS